jgi:hypothetical protein
MEEFAEGFDTFLDENYHKNERTPDLTRNILDFEMGKIDLEIPF